MDEYRGKYTPLFRHLMEFGGKRWPATFAEVEVVLGFPLPKSARKHSAWWANEQDGQHSHARAWLAAGWRTSEVSLTAQTLVFEREPAASAPAKSGRRPRRRTSIPSERGPARGMSEAVRAAETAEPLTLGGQTFQFAAHVSPEAGPDGKPLEEMPQQRYRDAASTPLNRHGHGPFCRFSVPGLPATSGVYAVTVAQALVYVGKAKDLQRRWGPSGYAQIQPRNCFKQGQSTNCKVNHRILLAAQAGLAVRLWTHQTATPRPLEERLIAKLAPPWNDQR